MDSHAGWLLWVGCAVVVEASVVDLMERRGGRLVELLRAGHSILLATLISNQD